MSFSEAENQLASEMQDTTPVIPTQPPPKVHPPMASKRPARHVNRPKPVTPPGVTKKPIVSGKRHKKPKNLTVGMVNNEIKRLARRGGVKRINGHVYDKMRRYQRKFLTRVLFICCELSNLTKRSTIMLSDVEKALEMSGYKLYGVLSKPPRSVQA